MTELFESGGSEVYDFNAVYTVVETDGVLRVASIAHDELPELRAALAGAGDGDR